MSPGRAPLVAIAAALTAAIVATPAFAEPAGPPPGGRAAAGPPAAWIETADGARWLSRGSGCWPAPAGLRMCSIGQNISDRPLVRVQAGEVVRVHLGRLPDGVFASAGLHIGRCARGLEPTPAARGRAIYPLRGEVVSWRAQRRDHGYLRIFTRYAEGDLVSLARLEVSGPGSAGPPAACRPDHTPPRLVGVEVERTRAGLNAVVSVAEAASAAGALQRLTGGRALLLRTFAARRGPVSSQQTLRMGALAAGVYRLRLTLRDRAGNVAPAARRFVVSPPGS